MRKHLLAITLFALSLIVTQCKSGLVTMSNSCYKAIDEGQTQNKSGNYAAALDNFNMVLQKCDAYDAKEKGFAGKAAALNGMGQYSDALAAANEGLKINKTSIANLFERAGAELKLGMSAEAKADLNTITDLTQKNQNVAQRATIYAKMAEIDTRNQMYNEALSNIQQAINLDNSNLDFYMQRGDINTVAGNYPEAIRNYDEAITKGRTDLSPWKSKVATLIKMNQQKYGTNSADVLAKKMNSSEKQTLCSSIREAQGKGLKDMTIDLTQAALCK
ncbi:tetratricopeptide repeat protein [Flavitalea flava]